MHQIIDVSRRSHLCSPLTRWNTADDLLSLLRRPDTYFAWATVGPGDRPPSTGQASATVTTPCWTWPQMPQHTTSDVYSHPTDWPDCRSYETKRTGQKIYLYSVNKNIVSYIYFVIGPRKKCMFIRTSNNRTGFHYSELCINNCVNILNLRQFHIHLLFTRNNHFLCRFLLSLLYLHNQGKPTSAATCLCLSLVQCC